MADRVIIGKRSKWWNEETRLAYLLLFPAVFVLVAFMFYPIVYVFLMSFFNADKLGRLRAFSGLKNYRTLLATKEFWKVTGRSIIWTAVGVFSKTIFGLVIALLLNVEYRGRKFSRMLFIVPWASAVPISAMLWMWVYNPEFGLLNYTLEVTGLWKNPPIWLGKPISAFVACMWVDIWIGIPFMALVFLAGMQSIPSERYESAYIDGVNSVQKFFYITIPGIGELLMIATLLSSLWTFNDFNVIYILTRGGPANSTNILITSVYQYGFEWLKFNTASVMAVVTFLILSVVSIIYAGIYFKREGE